MKPTGRHIPLIRAQTDPKVWEVCWKIAMPHMPDDGRPIMTYTEGSNAGFRISLILDRRRRGMAIQPGSKKPPRPG